jgi:Zn-dependent protease
VSQNAQQARTASRRGGRPVGRVLGIPVFVSPSMLLLAVLVTYVYGGYAESELGLAVPLAYAVGLGFVFFLMGSVLLHELGHAMTARRYGIGVRGITLELLGGWTEMDRDAPHPRADALVSLAGPAVSLVIGSVATVFALLLPERTVAGEIAFQLAASNIIVAVFNVLPGLPLDGGRALRALVWAMVKDRNRATEVAAWAGRGLALATMALVITLYQLRILTLLGVVFTLLVAFTLWQGAGQSLRLARMTRRFPLIDLGTLARPLFPVPSGTSLGEAERRAGEQERARRSLAVADANGRVIAVVDPAAAAAVPVQRRPWVVIDSVARDIADLPSLRCDLTGEQVVRAVQAHPVVQYAVTTGEDVTGVLHVADLAEVLEPRRRARRTTRDQQHQQERDQ